MKPRMPVLLVVAAALSATLACAAPSGRLYVRVGPPAPIAEVRSVSPGPDFVWIEGYHRWDGRAYVWVPGRWERRPQPRAEWVPGRWEHDRRGWFYVDGHWRG